MKFYINYNSKKEALPKKGKIEELCADGAFPVHNDFNFDKTPDDLSLIAVEDHSSFEVAFMLTQEQWLKMTIHNDRPFKLLLYPRDKAMEMSGMKTYLEC
jgi:hypothetical protein